MLEAKNYGHRQARKRQRMRSSSSFDSLANDLSAAQAHPSNVPAPIPQSQSLTLDVIPTCTPDQLLALDTMDLQYGVRAKGKWTNICQNFIQAYPQYACVTAERLIRNLQDRLSRYRSSTGSHKLLLETTKHILPPTQLTKQIPETTSHSSIVKTSHQSQPKACCYCVSVKRGAKLCATGTAKKCTNHSSNKPDITQGTLNFLVVNNNK